jgi:hypothetical protein
MRAKSNPEIPEGFQQIILGANQAEYVTLHAAINPDDPTCPIVSEWEFTAQELAQVMKGGVLRITVWTFGRHFSPIQVEVKPHYPYRWRAVLDENTCDDCRTAHGKSTSADLDQSDGECTNPNGCRCTLERIDE